MTFLELFKALESDLGYHQVPLNHAATGLKDLFDSSPLHHDFMKRLAQTIYTANACRRVTDPVDRAATFEAVGPLRGEVLRSERTDVDLFHVLEELCVALDRSFGVAPAVREPPKRVQLAQVIELAPFRRRRLRSLA